MKLLGKGKRWTPLPINVAMKGRSDRCGVIPILDLSGYAETSNLELDAMDDNDDVDQSQKLPTNGGFTDFHDFG